MVFSSIVFLSVFLPAVFLLYTVIPSLKVRNALLIAASLVFYAYGEPVYVLLMLFSSLLNYFCALWVAKNPQKKSKAALVTAVAVNLGILAVFKYTGMFVTTFNSLTGLAVPVPAIALPIGISFFTFQALSYVIDVYRGAVDVQKNYFHILLYITFFPQLIAGPIVKYRDISRQISEREQSVDKIARGFRRFICGLAKKVLIANAMGQVADVLFSQDASTMALPTAWLGAIAYLFQIYYDFSGYSDMAIGLVSLRLKQCADFLEKMAHLAVHMVQGVSVHSARRQPQGQAEDCAQPHHRVFLHGTVARCELDVCAVGTVARSVPPD